MKLSKALRCSARWWIRAISISLFVTGVVMLITWLIVSALYTLLRALSNFG